MKHVSKRDEIKRNGIREIMEIAIDMDESVIQLQVGEPVLQTPDFIKDAAIDAIQNDFTRYTSNAGYTTLRQAIINRFKTKYDLEYNLNNIIVTPGAVAAINILLLSIVDEGEEVLIPDPSYPNYDALIKIQNAKTVYYSTDANNKYLPDVNSIKDKITDKTKVIILNSPNNPTGAVIPKALYKQIIDIAKERDIYIISDEIYEDLTYGVEHTTALSIDSNYSDRVIGIFGFSKSFAMTGWRLGYAIIPESLFEVTTKLQEPITTCASSISQKAGEAALTSLLAQEFIDDSRKLYENKRDLACSLLSKFNLDFVKPDGAFYIVVDISKTKMNSLEFAKELLKDRKVAVAPCNTFGPSGESKIRICFAGEDTKLIKGIEIFAQFYHEKILSN